MEGIIESYRNKGCRSSVLEELRQQYKGNHFYGVTINCPRTGRFIRWDSNKQKELYKQVFKSSLGRVAVSKVKHYIYTYEYCKDGQVHMHGLVWYPKVGDITGFLMDLDRQIRISVNKVLRIRIPYKSIYDDKYKRIRKPLNCLQYMNSPEELDRWLEYIHKEYVEKI